MDQQSRFAHRHFIAAELHCPWNDPPVHHRLVIAENMRHMTFAFLDKISTIPSLLTPSFPVAPVGIFDRLLLFPEDPPRSISYHATFLSSEELVHAFHHALIFSLQQQDFPIRKETFLPHVTLAREDCTNAPVWKEWFRPLPFYLKAFHLYESLGRGMYRLTDTHLLRTPFDHIAHIADLAFIVRGKTLDDVYLHAVLCLAFSFPPILPFLQKTSVGSLNMVIKKLNQLITETDIALGCPFKAVSYYGKLIQTDDNLYEWEMVVDV